MPRRAPTTIPAMAPEDSFLLPPSFEPPIPASPPPARPLPPSMPVCNGPPPAMIVVEATVVTACPLLSVVVTVKTDVLVASGGVVVLLSGLGVVLSLLVEVRALPFPLLLFPPPVLPPLLPLLFPPPPELLSGQPSFMAQGSTEQQPLKLFMAHR